MRGSPALLLAADKGAGRMGAEEDGMAPPYEWSGLSPRVKWLLVVTACLPLVVYMLMVLMCLLDFRPRPFSDPSTFARTAVAMGQFPVVTLLLLALIDFRKGLVKPKWLLVTCVVVAALESLGYSFCKKAYFSCWYGGRVFPGPPPKSTPSQDGGRAPSSVPTPAPPPSPPPEPQP